MSQRRVLGFKPQLRLEWRGQDGQSEAEQPDHPASLGDSNAASHSNQVFGTHSFLLNPTDLAMLLSVMAGYDRRTPLSLTEPASTFAAPLKRDVAGTRIGWLGDLNGIPMETGMLDLCLGALRRLESAGCKVEPATLGVSRDVIWKSFVTLRQGFLAGALAPLYKDPAKQSLFKPEASWEIEGGMRLSAVDLYAASIQRSTVYQAFDRLFRTI